MLGYLRLIYSQHTTPAGVHNTAKNVADVKRCEGGASENVWYTLRIFAMLRTYLF